MPTAEKELEAYLGEEEDIQGIVERTNPGTWDVGWVQVGISYDPKGPPEERCVRCGEYEDRVVVS